MSDTPLLGLPLIEAAQAQKHVSHNEALLLLDAALHLAVLSRSLAAPPASPAEGDRYLVAAGATGAWASHSGQIAFREAGIWRFATPREGWRLWVNNEDLLLVYDGAIWRDIPISVLQNMAMLGINTTADTSNRLAVSSPGVLFTHAGTDQRLKINKQAAANTASLLYQTNFSGRAELGLTGSDDFRFKVSPNGTAWLDALVIDKDDGAVSFPQTPVLIANSDPAEGDFWTDVGSGANIWRARDRLKVGDAADDNGTFNAPHNASTRSWVGINALGYGTLLYFDVRSQFASFSTKGGIGGAFASRTSDNALAENGCIGAASFADNDHPSAPVSAWAYYGHAVKRAGSTGHTFGMELDIGNQSSASVALDPYQMGNAGTTACLWLGCGGESAQLEPLTHYPADVCIGIVTSGDASAAAWAKGQVITAVGTLRKNAGKLYSATTTGTTGATAPTHSGYGQVVSDGGVSWAFSHFISPSRFKKGIVFQALALTGTDGAGTGSAVAIEMARGHEIVGKYGGGDLTTNFKIRGDGNSAALQSRIVFTNTGMEVRNVQGDFVTENPFAFAVLSSNPSGVNGVAIYPGSAGSGPVVVSQGETNVALQLRGKGTGIASLQGADGTLKVSANSTGLGFYAATPVAKPTVTGNRDSDAATSLLAGLSTLGLVTNSSVAGTKFYGRQMTAGQIMN